MTGLIPFFLLIIGLAVLRFGFIPYLSKILDSRKFTTSGKEIANDQIIRIQNIEIHDLEKIIEQFYEGNNQEITIAKPMLSILSKDKFLITFPKNIDFLHFCWFINYLRYPNNTQCKPILKAWATPKSEDSFMPKEVINKRVMIYIPEDDKEYDNVYLTAYDNIGYKISIHTSAKNLRTSSPLPYEDHPNFPDPQNNG